MSGFGGGFSAFGRGGRLCRFVQIFRGSGLHNGRLRLRQGKGCGVLEHGERGAQADAGRGFGIVEKVGYGSDGEGGVLFGGVALVEHAVVLGLEESAGEGGVGAAPVPFMSRLKVTAPVLHE